MSARTPSDLRCPICRRPSAEAEAPFCSRRCRDADMLNWFSNRYTLPGAPAEEEGEGVPGAAPPLDNP